jgi:hypothetical protein
MSGKVSIAKKILIIENLDLELKQLSKNLATMEFISKTLTTENAFAELWKIKSLFLGENFGDETFSLSKVMQQLQNEIISFMEVLDFARGVYSKNDLSETNYDDYKLTFKTSSPNSTSQSSSQQSQKINVEQVSKHNESNYATSNSLDEKFISHKPNKRQFGDFIDLNTSKRVKFTHADVAKMVAILLAFMLF